MASKVIQHNNELGFLVFQVEFRTWLRNKLRTSVEILDQSCNLHFCPSLIWLFPVVKLRKHV